MKVALIHFSAPPVIGGVEKVVGEQTAILRAQGHHVSLACFDGGETVRADSFIPLSREATTEQLTAYLLASLGSMDAVLMHNVGTMPFCPELTGALRSLAQQLPSTRWICWVHDLAFGNPDYSPVANLAYRALMETGCPQWEYIAVSEARASETRVKLGVKCTVIPNGIDLATTLNLCPKIATLAETRGWWDADFVLLHPTRILPRKSIETGIRLTAALATANRNVHYLVTGAPDPHNPDKALYGSSLRDLCRTLRMESRVHFLQDTLPIGPAQLSSLYSVADALFFPSLQEGFGLPLLEAAAFRLPAFCADREPMRSLPGAIPFNPRLTPVELSAWIIQRIDACEPIMARNSLAKTYRWQAIYRNFLAPFLTHPQTSTQ